MKVKTIVLNLHRKKIKNCFLLYNRYLICIPTYSEAFATFFFGSGFLLMLKLILFPLSLDKLNLVGTPKLFFFIYSFFTYFEKGL